MKFETPGKFFKTVVVALLKWCTRNCSFLYGHGIFACVGCEVKYLTQIVYDHFTMTVVKVKRPYIIAIKYLTSQAKQLCPSRKLHLLRTPF